MPSVAAAVFCGKCWLKRGIHSGSGFPMPDTSEQSEVVIAESSPTRYGIAGGFAKVIHYSEGFVNR